MNIKNHILVVALAAMPVAALQAQTYNDTLRTKTWSVYGAGGFSGYHGLRSGSNTGVRSAIDPDFSIGVKYYLNPKLRAGLNLGYTKVKGINNGNDATHTQTVTNNFQIGNYNDGVLTVDKIILVNRTDIHFAALDLNADYNLLDHFKNRNQRWNLWLGAGIGYLHGWYRGGITTAISEEGVAKGPDHFNVYNKDYITTESTTKGVNTLYVPIRLSAEYDITPNWTFGAKGEYKCIPLKNDFTPKGIWSLNLSIAYNFIGKRFQKPAHQCNDNRELIDRLNETIRQLRSQCDDCSDSRKSLEEELKQAKDEIARLKAQPQIIETAVHFDKNKSIVKDVELEKLDAVAKELQKFPDLKVVVNGWASTDGRKGHNVKLSKRRANAVANLLRNKYGIDSSRISVSAGGGTEAQGPTLDENRVVMIIRVAK